MGIQLYGTGFTPAGSEPSFGENTNQEYTYDIDVTGGNVTITGDFGDSHSASSGSSFFVESGTVPNVGTWSDVASDGTFTYTITQAEYAAAGGTPLSFQFTARGAEDDTLTINVICFAAGTEISTPDGGQTGETLCIGDLINTADGRRVPVKWIGRQSLSALFGGAALVEPVQISAGALGNGLPQTDLVVTADHGMVIDGLVVNASALINGSTIRFVPHADLPAQLVVYHIETEGHEVILANGAPSETYLDIPGREVFDNYAEYLALYGAQTPVAEMTAPRITNARFLPATLQARLFPAVAA